MAKTDGRSKSVTHSGRTTTATEKPELGWTHKLTVDGEEYALDRNAVSALDDQALLKASGGVTNAANALFEGGTPTLVGIAGFMWLSLRQHGERPDFNQIAGKLTLGSEVDVELADGDEGDESPEE